MMVEFQFADDCGYCQCQFLFELVSVGFCHLVKLLCFSK